MWLLIFAGLLTVTVAKETVANVADKPEVSSKNDDVVLLEIDVKEPAKRSPQSANAVYGAAPNQYIIRHGEEPQEVSPEYLSSLIQQYARAPQGGYASAPAPQHSNAQPQPRRPISTYTRQQQELQQAYHRQRVPIVAPPRPPLTLHPQALAEAEINAEIQGQKENQLRQKQQNARLRNSAAHVPNYQVPAGYSNPKLGTFEQELLQLVNANQAQEFKLVPVRQPNQKLLKEAYQQPQYSQQVLAYPVEYAKPVTESAHVPEQYHVETSQPNYQPAPADYQQQRGEDIVQLQYHQAIVPSHREQQEYARPEKPTRPPPAYQYVEDPGRLKAIQNEEADAQARAEAQALAYQRVAQDSHNKHQQAALEQIRLVHERHRQQAALEQIKEGIQVSEAGQAHIEEQYRPRDPESAYRAKLKAQATATVANERRQQEADEYKAHADAILNLQATQQAHVRAQEEAHRNALNFESNQIRAQAQAQALANAQAEALYKAHQQQRAKARSETQAAVRAQTEARKKDPNAPVIQYLLPNNEPLPSPNSYFTDDQVRKYQAAGSNYVARAAPQKEGAVVSTEDAAYVSNIQQPKQAYKHKIPSTVQSSIYVSQSGLLKKAPVKSVTVEEIIDQDQVNPAQFIRVSSPKIKTLTQEDLATLINAGYTVTPIPDTIKPTPQPYGIESSSTGYYVKKQRGALVRPDYVTYEQVTPRGSKRPNRKSQVLKEAEHDGDASEKITYLIPVEPVYGTRKPLQKQE